MRQYQKRLAKIAPAPTMDRVKGSSVPIKRTFFTLSKNCPSLHDILWSRQFSEKFEFFVSELQMAVANLFLIISKGYLPI